MEVSLPADCPVAELIPGLLDLVRPGLGSPAGPLRWHLSRLGGVPLEPSMTLRQNAIDDGELLVMTTAPVPVPRHGSDHPCALVIEAGAQDSPVPLERAAAAATLMVALVSAAVLIRSGSGGSGTAVWVLAGLAVGAAVVTRVDRRIEVVAQIAAVAFAAAAGAVAVPDAPWDASALLAAAAALAMSILLCRLTYGRGTPAIALAALSAVGTAVGAAGVAAAWPPVGTAVGMVALSVGALSAAPQLTVAVCRLGPSQPGPTARRAESGHRVLTGLVAGWAGAAGLGAAVAVATAPPASAALAALFAADIGVLLVLRARSHRDVTRRITLGAAGIGALVAGYAGVAVALPHRADVLCVTVMALGAAALYRAARGPSANPVGRQCVAAAEYLALAAVLPLGGWLAGLYGLVRELSLT